MRVQLNRSRAERGAVAVVVAVIAPVILVLAGFTLDFGATYAQARAFSTGADSAALAVVNAKRTAINNAPATPTSCKTIVDNDGGQALTVAKNQVGLNAPNGMTLASGNVSVSVQLQCLDKNGNSDDNGLLKATVTVSRSVPTTLGQMVGVAAITATKDGSAALGVARQVNGMFPLAFCKDVADDIVTKATAAGQPFPFYDIEVDKVWNNGTSCSAGNKGSGNWGWLNCGSGVSAVDIGSYISNGCNADLTLSGAPPTTSIEGAPGNKINSSNVTGPLTAALGKTYAFPIYKTIGGNGSNTFYTIVAFIELRIIAYDKDGNVTVQYVSYSPVGDINNLCGIGNIQCTAYNAWAVGLVQ
jgi:Flp pilus assembly protein TadG